MFFDDTKTTYSIEKRFLDLKWVIMVNDAIISPHPRKAFHIEGVGKVIIITNKTIFAENTVLMYLETMPNKRGAMQARVSNPEYLQSKKHLDSLILRTTNFWANRVENKHESMLYGSPMEHCFYETLERLAHDGALKWEEPTFTVLNLDAWYAGVHLFCGWRVRDSAIAWIRLLGWVSINNTVPPPARCLVTKPRIVAPLCLTYRKLTPEERSDVVFFEAIVKNSSKTC
jgi:hypothetical protein